VGRKRTTDAQTERTSDLGYVSMDSSLEWRYDSAGILTLDGTVLL
jgi:hypothetical protein